MLSLSEVEICVIGLGYVGLPLAVEFGKKFPTIGFDINQARVDELEGGSDSTLECSPEELAEATSLTFSTSLQDLIMPFAHTKVLNTPAHSRKHGH